MLNYRLGTVNEKHWGFKPDFVPALPCTSLPAEILAWFDAMRPGYWPPLEVFEIAKQCPCFLVADGYRGSPTEYIEWRITPNLIERHLMFSLKKRTEEVSHCVKNANAEKSRVDTTFTRRMQVFNFLL